MIGVSTAGSALAPQKLPSVDHIPSLDGLRAISIALVLLGHLYGTRGFVVLNLGVGDYAQLGVTVFFVISGFLITRLLFLEHSKNGRISLKLFYARRSLRIFPASYAYIACVSLLWMAGIIQIEARDFWHAVTYTVNFLPNRSWPLGHFWSLSVEEQFYLLWPSTFVMLGARRANWVAAGVILFGPVARTAARVFLIGTPYRYLEMFPMVADSLAVGCLLASVSGWLERRKWYLELFRPGYTLGMFGLILLINRYMAHTVVAVFGTSIINITIAILIHRFIYCSGDWIGQFLNWKPIAFVGVLSYSLYVWQQLFLNPYSTAWANAFPQNVAFAIAASLASYFLLERPFLKLRRHLRA